VSRKSLAEFPGIIPGFINTEQIAVITTDKIYALYGHAVVDGLRIKGNVLEIFIPEGEKAKSLDQVEKVYTTLLENRFERNSLIIAFGGGVVGDMAGFVAATYLRGVPLVQLPTTLLAQVDSSIGGKVGVNHPLGKNLIGAFKHPLFVFSDCDVLMTLEPAELRCGLGEVIKYGFISDSRLFEYLESHLDEALDGNPDVLLELVKASAAIKADVVRQDEREQNLRMILNFGHTFGHALEAESHFSTIKHGEAVILGMQCALEYTRLSGLLGENVYQRGMRLLKRVPVPYDGSELHISRLVERMTLDKKVKDKKIRLVLIDDIGSYRIETVADIDTLEKAWKILI
jgi:3-dehydroquinate synthase